VAGLAHAGWRGAFLGIGPRAVRGMAEHFGSRASDILVGIGPSIGPCCYEVGDDVVAAARGALGGVDGVILGGSKSRPRLDLWEANRRLLLSVGVLPDHIEPGGLCTACHVDEFYSHRREGGRTGRFGAAVGLLTDEGSWSARSS